MHVLEKLRGMSGARPSFDNKSLHLKSIHSCRMWTIGDVKENRAEANVRRGEAGGDGWIFQKVWELISKFWIKKENKR